MWLSVSDSELSVDVELHESLSELKWILEVAELPVYLDSGVLHSEFGIWWQNPWFSGPPILMVYCSQPTWWMKGRFKYVFQLGILFFKSYGVTIQQIYTRDRNGPISLPLSSFEVYPGLWASRPTPLLLKIGIFRENGKMSKRPNLQNIYIWLTNEITAQESCGQTHVHLSTWLITVHKTCKVPLKFSLHTRSPVHASTRDRVWLWHCIVYVYIYFSNLTKCKNQYTFCVMHDAELSEWDLGSIS